MKKSILIFLMHLVMLFANGQPNFVRGRISVAPDGQFLQYEDGRPFFWLGDTAWELIHLLKREEIVHYLDVRKAQGFNVIQTVALSEFGGLVKPNAYGQLPLRRSSGGHFEVRTIAGKYDYWKHLDFIIDEAAKRGMYLALLPCWGEYVIPREGNGIFKTPSETYKYGHFFGDRYKNRKNVIWILGGDRLPDEVPGGIALWRAMAKGIADGTNGQDDAQRKTDYTTTLMTYHCFQSSSTWFQNDEWLDMNMWGSYHDNFNNTRAFEQVYKDDSLAVLKPTLNGEPAYEEHPVNWQPENGEFKAYDVRQIAYWSVFAGACGHTYGNASIWQFFDVKRKSAYDAHTPWQKALFDPGAQQMIYLKQLMESRCFFGRKPARYLIVSGEGTGGDHAVATQGKDFALIYLPTGRPVGVRIKNIASAVKAWWYNPRNGKARLIGEYKNEAEHAFSPPPLSDKLAWLRTGRGCDWVLVIDDARAAYLSPGEIQSISANTIK